MSNLYMRLDGVGFDDLFEPDPNGVQIPGFYAADGVTLLRYAPLSAGSKIADVTHFHPDGPDVTNYWAGKGTVAYVVPSMPDIGGYDFPFSNADSVDWYPARVLNRIVFAMKRDGTYSLRMYTRNFVAIVVKTKKGNNLGYLYPDGVNLNLGNWAESPRPDFGDGYTIDYTLEHSEYGRWWIRVNHVDHQFQPGIYGGFDNQIGTITGIGTGLTLDQDRVIEVMADMNATRNNWDQRDPNAALRRYNRGRVYCVVKRNGQPVLTFRYYYCMTNTWSDLDIVVREGGSGGGGGTGGGGGGDVGCVATSMWMDTERQASSIAIGDWIDGSAYNPDTMVPRQVRQNTVVKQPCWEMTTVSGISITASDSTPMTMRDGSCMMFGPDMMEQEVFVNDRGDLRWEKVATMEYVGVQDVVLFNVDDQSYFAGTCGDRRIATHNAQQEKQLQ